MDATSPGTVLLKPDPLKPRTTEHVLQTCRPKTEARYRPILEENGLGFPPANLILSAFKEEKRLDVYTESGGRKIKLHSYPFTADSGRRGPKRREGDRQIPEGIYGIGYLNPNSRFHLSLKINYPNARDRQRAAAAGISDPGTDIFIHGGAASIGCMAIGDAYIEELYTLVALTGTAHVRILIFPNDARSNGAFLPCETGSPDTESLYEELYTELKGFVQ